MDQPRDQSNEAPAGKLLEMSLGGVHPPLPQQLGGHTSNSWVGKDSNTLLVVATLITALTYQLGTNIPGGYWQDSQSTDGAVQQHRAGDPVLRDLNRSRYWLYMVSSWVGFASSMVMTLSLLLQMAAASRHVRWSFAVAYCCLVLTFVLSQPRTHLPPNILILTAVGAFLWVTVSRRRSSACSAPVAAASELKK